MGIHSTRIIGPELRARLARIRSVIFDIDGVLTDDTLWVGPERLEFKRFHVSDGLAIALMRKRLKIKVAAVSGRHSEATTSRTDELGIAPCLQGVQDKRQGVARVLKAHRVKADRVAYVGNEILDLPAFAEVGLKVAVADAVTPVLERADLVLRRRGGGGVARELFDLICSARGIDYVGWYS